MKISGFTQKSFLLALARCHGSLWQHLHARLQETHCNLTDALIILSIFFEPIKVAQPSQLAQALHTSRSNTSHAINRLERLKLLKRSLSLYDARSYEVRLTPEGKRLAHRLIKEIDSFEKALEKKAGKNKMETLVHDLQQLVF